MCAMEELKIDYLTMGTSIIESARETHTVDSNNIYESVTIVIEL